MVTELEPRTGAAALSPFGRAWRHALAFFLFSLLALVLLEVGMRVAGRFVRSDRTGEGGANGPVWLCVGDSNVYGLWVAPEESYPAALNRQLGGAAHAINAGLPGANSHMLLTTLPRQLDEYEPDLVLLTIGANNSWTWNTGAEYQYEELPWYEELKVVRLARLIKLALSAEDLDPPAPDEFDPTPGLSADGRAELTDRAGQRVTLQRSEMSYSDLSESEVVETLGRDLATLADLVHAAGAELVLVGYGADDSIYTAANVGLRSAASELGLTLIQPHPAVAAAAAARGFDVVFFHDSHPRPPGYAVVAAEVARGLAARGLWPDAAPRPGDLPAAAPEPAGSSITLSSEGRFHLEGGAPERRFRLLIWGARAPGGPSPITSREELLADPLYKASQHADVFKGRFDSAGSASIELDAFMASPLGAALSGRELSAAFVLLTEKDSWATMGRTHTLRVP